MSNSNIQHKIMICSGTNSTIMPVDSCIQVLTKMVTKNMVMAAKFEKHSDSEKNPREGIRKPVHTQMNVVPQSLDN
ncbi:hypothetical protein ACHQM5_021464 [Ranunculus cassubicifolius]